MLGSWRGRASPRRSTRAPSRARLARAAYDGFAAATKRLALLARSASARVGDRGRHDRAGASPVAESNRARGGSVASDERVRAFLRPRTARRSTGCSPGDGFAPATSPRRASCSHIRIRATRMRSMAGAVRRQSRRRAQVVRPEVESSPRRFAALALLARTKADTAPVTGRASWRSRAATRLPRRRASSARPRSSETLRHCCSPNCARLYAARITATAGDLALERDRDEVERRSPEAPRGGARSGAVRCDRGPGAGSGGDRAPRRTSWPRTPREARFPATGATRAGGRPRETASRHRVEECPAVIFRECVAGELHPGFAVLSSRPASPRARARSPMDDVSRAIT